MNILAIGMTLGILGAGLFGTGLLLSMEPLIITGIVLISASVLLFVYIYFTKKTPTFIADNPIYTSGMKRNKSDTDLELMHQETLP